MRIYLAARNYRLDELRGYADDLRTMGHQVTSRWLQGRHQAPGSLDHPQWPGIAQEDVDDLAAADAVISITEQVRGGGGGRHVEFGLGLAWGKRMLLVGAAENLFHTLPSVEAYPTWEDALAGLGSEGAESNP
ncbi:MAG: hypothetical protein J4F46_04945 [Dehalococcoidia bacterium]|nr:hypothetical protein [Dehalococcoidia bacterium]